MSVLVLTDIVAKCDSYKLETLSLPALVANRHLHPQINC